MGLTPGKSGELTKSYWLREIAGPERAPLARTAPIVFAERLVDGIAMLLLATSGLVSFRFGGAGAARRSGVGRAGGGPDPGPAVGARPDRGAQTAHSDRPRCRDPRDDLRQRPRAADLARLALAVGVGVVSWGGECLALYVILLGLGAAPSLELLNQATFALAAGSLVGSASLLPGGLGAAEGTVAAVLDLVARQPRDTAAAATLLIRVCTLWFGVALGAASLVTLARRLGL